MSNDATQKEVSGVNFNDIVSWMYDSEEVMTEVVRAMHADVPMIEHGLLIRAVMTQDPADLLRARAVVDCAITAAADNRANRLKIMQETL